MKKFLMIWKVISSIVTIMLLLGAISITLGNGWRKYSDALDWYLYGDSFED